jgi:Protein of unknown function (DUF2867)
MRLPTSAHTSQPWRIRELAPDFEIEDVWALPTPGGPGELPRLMSAWKSGDTFPEGAPLLVRALWEARWKIGRVMGCDKGEAGIGTRVASLRDRLPADLRAAPTGPDFENVPMTSVYLLEDEWAAELANRTVHSIMHIGWVTEPDGSYRGQMAVLVKPNGWFGAAYMAAIKPFRYLFVYPALMRSIERAWKESGAANSAATAVRGQLPARARRVTVTEPIAAAGPYDYADAFELRLEGPDRCSPEEWVRAGVDAVPPWIKRVAGAKDGLGSARIVESDADVVVLEDSDPLMDTVMIGRNVEPERRVLTTVLRYRRPLLTRAVWALVGILHRRTARQVVAAGLPH